MAGGHIIEIRDLMFRYSSSDSTSAEVGRLEIGGGGLTLLYGMTGSGKTTLLRVINGLIPHYYGGRMGGRVTIDGMDTREVKPREISGRVGTVFQDPESQLLMLGVREEISFGLRNAGLTEQEVESEVRLTARALGVEPLLGRSIMELSSGQKQKVAIASALAVHPPYLLLDEPTSQLDDGAAAALMHHLSTLSSSGGITALLSEHRISRSASYCSRFIGMEGGRISSDGGYSDMEEWYTSRGIDIAGGYHVKHGEPGGPHLEMEGVDVSYGEQRVLRGVDAVISRGEIVALTGANGSGKSTLLKSIMNFVKRDGGSIRLDGEEIGDLAPAAIARRIGYLSHNPLNYLFQPTLKEEMLFSSRLAGGVEADGEIAAVAESLGLSHKLNMFPREFSCGEREAAAIAATIAGGRSCLLLDEPTRGMDYWRKDSFMGLLRALCRNSGLAVLMATHDSSIAGKWCDRAYSIADGRVRESPAGGE